MKTSTANIHPMATQELQKDKTIEGEEMMDLDDVTQVVAASDSTPAPAIGSGFSALSSGFDAQLIGVLSR